MATTAPPVIGGDGQWWQRLPQLLVTTPPVVGKDRDSGNRNDGYPRWLPHSLVTAPPVANGDGRWQQWQQCLPQLAVEMDNSSNISPSHQWWPPQSLIEMDNGNDNNNVSPRRWQRRMTAVTAPPVVGNGSPSRQWRRTMVVTTTTAPPVGGRDGERRQ